MNRTTRIVVPLGCAAVACVVAAIWVDHGTSLAGKLVITGFVLAMIAGGVGVAGIE